MNISLSLFDIAESQMKTGRINATVFKNEAINLDNDDQVST